MTPLQELMMRMESKRGQDSMQHKPAPLRPDQLKGRDALTDWAIGVGERGTNPLQAMANYSQEFQNMEPMDQAMQILGGGMAGTIGKIGKGVTKRAMSVPAKTKYELAHEVAQRNAAKPVSEGGLGLPANNMPLDRAKAMGFDTPAYHGTNADIEQFKASEKFVDKFFFAHNPKVASKYASINAEGQNVIPVLLKTGNQKKQDISKLALGNIDMAKNKGFESYTATDSRIPETTIMFDPANIRSRFAAFDPMRRNSPDILGNIDPQLLKILAGGSAAGLLGTAGYSSLQNREGQ